MCDARPEPRVELLLVETYSISYAWRMRCHHRISETTGKQFSTYRGLLEI